MKIEPTNAATLSAIIENDIEAIRRLNSQLEQINLRAGEVNFRDLAAVTYILHTICNALENSFEHLSREFENNVKDVSQWHKELLMKMFLEIPGIRPAVFPSTCRMILNELRGFRHVFRHSYDFDLDPQRLTFLVDRWNHEGDAVLNALNSFSSVLRNSAKNR